MERLDDVTFEVYEEEDCFVFRVPKSDISILFWTSIVNKYDKSNNGGRFDESGRT